MITEREFDVLSRLASGMTRDAVAQSLGISRNTLYRHVGKAQERFDVATLVELYAALGWLRVPPTWSASRVIPADHPVVGRLGSAPTSPCTDRAGTLRGGPMEAIA